MASSQSELLAGFPRLKKLLNPLGGFPRGCLPNLRRQFISPVPLRLHTQEGKEPDVAYSFGTDKSKPDIAVEINLTSGSIDERPRPYAKLEFAAVPLQPGGCRLSEGESRREARLSKPSPSLAQGNARV